MSTNRYIDKLKAQLAKEIDKRMQFQALFENQVAGNRALLAELDAMKELVTHAAAVIRNADAATGVCCCGSPVETHGFGDGHSPVDQGDYFAMDLLSRIDAALQGEQP